MDDCSECVAHAEARKHLSVGLHKNLIIFTLTLISP